MPGHDHSPQRRTRLWPWLLPGALSGLGAIPAVRTAAPVLGTLWGPLGWIASVAALGALLVRRGRRHGAQAALTGDPGRGVARRALPIIAAAAASLVVGLFYVQQRMATGDEPHYLIMAQSLWKEHDLDILDNMQRRDFGSYSYGFEPHFGRPRADGSPFPFHNPGLPFLLAPVFAIGGRPACVVLLALMLAALGWACQRLARIAGGDLDAERRVALIALAPPVFVFAFQIYTELPCALAASLALVWLLTPVATAGPAIAAALATAALPWLHTKLLPAAIVLGVIALLRLRGRALVSFLAVAALAAIGYLAFYHSEFGIPLPLTGGRFPPRGFRDANVLAAALGLWLDREFGLLPSAPVYLLGLAGLPALFARERWRQAWPMLAVAAAVIAMVLPWRMWWGGQCPPARMLLPLLPVLAVAAGLRCAERPTGLARWQTPLLVTGFVVLLARFTLPDGPSVSGVESGETSVWGQLFWGTPLTRYLPNLVRPAAMDWALAAVWIMALATLLLLDRRARRDERVDGWFRSPGLPLAVWLGAGLAIDAVAHAQVLGWTP
jgi:hypothetical protein